MNSAAIGAAFSRPSPQGDRPSRSTAEAVGMRSLGRTSTLAFALALAVVAAACSSSAGDDATSGTGVSPSGPGSGEGCAARAGLSGPIEDLGSAEASGGAVTLDASEFAFAPTCVEVGAGETLEVTVANTGSALHNLTIESLGIDEDVQAGETTTVEVMLADSASVPFFCKYHVANGMQGAFLTG